MKFRYIDEEQEFSSFEKRQKKEPNPYKRVDPKRQKKDNYSEARRLKRGEDNGD